MLILTLTLPLAFNKGLLSVNTDLTSGSGFCYLKY